MIFFPTAQMFIPFGTSLKTSNLFDLKTGNLVFWSILFIALIRSFGGIFSRIIFDWKFYHHFYSRKYILNKPSKHEPLDCMFV